jgi:hypothetical protein
VEFWWFHFFMKLKSQLWIWRSRCPLILANFFGKKWNCQALWGMEDWTLLSIVASFKKCRCWTPILPKCQDHLQASKKKVTKKEENCRIKWVARSSQTAGRGWWMTSGRLPATAHAPLFYNCHLFFQTPAPLFGHMWSTLSHWLQYMPTLPRLLPKSSNTHNFWSVVSKFMKFILTWSLFQDKFGKKFKKI